MSIYDKILNSKKELAVQTENRDEMVDQPTSIIRKVSIRKRFLF
jgi:hypothetical protein